MMQTVPTWMAEVNTPGTLGQETFLFDRKDTLMECIRSTWGAELEMSNQSDQVIVWRRHNGKRYRALRAWQMSPVDIITGPQRLTSPEA